MAVDRIEGKRLGCYLAPRDFLTAQHGTKNIEGFWFPLAAAFSCVKALLPLNLCSKGNPS
jgi:hypothetical protein